MSHKIGRLEQYRLYVEQYFSERPFFVPEHYVWMQDEADESSEKREYDLTMAQRCFVLLQEPTSCILAGWVSNFVLLVILVNVICNVYMTLPAHRQHPVTDCVKPACSDSQFCDGKVICPPTTDPFLVKIDDICVIIFSVEYFARLGLVSFVKSRLASLVPASWDEEEQFCARHEDRPVLLEPPQKWYWNIYSYFWQTKNLIDVIAIIPFYITVIDSDADASLSFIRVLRLFRIVRAFNMNANAGVTSLIIKTVTESMEVILLLLFFSAMIILIYGSIIFDVEMGKFTVDADYPTGAYLRKDLNGEVGESPFTSTLVGMYWAVITMTTVGYGDIYPVSVEGRLLAVTCAFVGVLFMALPISILGANFTVQYQRLSEQQRIERKKRATLLLSKKLEHQSGKEIKVDLEYEVAKSLVKEDKAKGKIGHFNVANEPNAPTAIGGVRTQTGNRIADFIVGKQLEAADARAEYLKNYEDEHTLVDGYSPSHRVPSAEVEMQLMRSRTESNGGESVASTPNRLPSRSRGGSLGSDSISDEAANTVLKAIEECAEPAQKRRVIKKLLGNIRVAASALSREFEDDMRRSAARFVDMTRACDAIVLAVEGIVDENTENANV